MDFVPCPSCGYHHWIAVIASGEPRYIPVGCPQENTRGKPHRYSQEEQATVVARMSSLFGHDRVLAALAKQNTERA